MSDSFTSTINLIPKEISRIKNSKIPFAINVVMEKFSEVNSQVTTREILRCTKCKTYLNPFVEIYPPGNLWKCNICMTVNKTELPLLSRQGFNQSNEFSPFQNRVNNFNGTNELELRELKYDVLAPSSFYNKPAPEPVFLFLIEATKSSISNGMLSSVLNCIFNNISLIPNTSGRSKIIISFFNSSVYILKKGLENSFLVVSDFSELPSFFCDDLVFKKEELILEIDKIVDYFTSLNEQINDLGGALSVTNKILNGGTTLLFLSSVPNEGLGKIRIEKGNMKCKSNFYKSITGEFTIKQTGINLFLFPQTNVELPTLSILSKFTGGCIFYYPNYESENPMFNSRFVSDFCVFFEQNIGLESVCRIRVPEGVNIKDYFGNLVLRSDGIISFPNFNSGHSFTFELEVTDSFIQNDLTIQIALLKTHENGEKIIKILNIAIPNEVSLAKYSDQIYLSNDFYKTIPFKSNLFFYDFINSDALVHYLALKAIYNETIQKGNGNTFLTNFLKKVSQNYRKILNLNQQNFILPPFMNDLPLKVLSLMKSIPLRPSSYTPMDFKAYYIYLFYTQYPSFVKKLIFPDLYAIHLLNEDEGLIINDKIVMPEPVRLSLDCLETNGLYLLNTGVNFYFFVGKDCDEDFAYQAVADASGSFLFTKHDNEVSLRLNNIVSHLWADKFISPSYYVVRDTGVPNVLMDIFFGYFVEDAVHGLPDLNGFLMNLND